MSSGISLVAGRVAEIATSVAQTAEVTSETQKGAEQLRSAAEELDRLAGELEALLVETGQGSQAQNREGPHAGGESEAKALKVRAPASRSARKA